MEAEAVIRDITESNTQLARLLSDEAGRLSVDVFATTYQRILADYLARGGLQIDPAESYQLAADLWAFLRKT